MMRAILVWGLIFFATVGEANSGYISEMELVLKSLSIKDTTRPTLTLRLADALFNEATGTQISDAGAVKAYRLKALGLYQESLSGLGGLFPSPAGAQKAKIQFQISRIFSDLGKTKEAQNLWIELSRQDFNPDIKRESLLRLAEGFEAEGSPKSLSLAEENFKQALELCRTQEVCSYIHYRLAWIFHRQNRAGLAIAEIEKSLWDSKGSVREEALRDYLLFLAQETGSDGMTALAKVEELHRKINRITLLEDLSNQFFAVGNKKAGILVLEEFNKKQPQIDNLAKLAEEFYGQRNWEKLQASFNEIEKLAPSSQSSVTAETEKILKRLSVQLDGERVSKPEVIGDFKQSVMVYLKLFPNRAKERAQMIDGWLAAETNPQEKLNHLAQWIGEEVAKNNTAEIKRLRLFRAAVAQNAKELNIIEQEMTELLKLAPQDDAATQWKYQKARALYDQRRYAEALVIFKQLAQPANKLSEFTVLSQHLALDILGMEKNYAAVIEQARSWTRHPGFEQFAKALPSKASEILEIPKIEQAALFEKAISEGDTLASLEVFLDYCKRKIMIEKSCGNAQVLAVKLKNQAAIIEVLKLTGNRQALADELEAAGRFGESAQIRWEMSKSQPASLALTDKIKIALLFELGNRMAERDQVLTSILSHWAKEAISEPLADLLFDTFRDAGKISAASLKWKWSTANKKRVIAHLESMGKGTAETKAAMLKSCENLGPAWEKLTWARIVELDDHQSKTKFVGRHSQALFQKRLAQLRQLNETAECVLQGSGFARRAEIAERLAMAQSNLATEILNSPIPQNLDAEAQDVIKKSLLEMAAPFQVRAEELKKMANENSEKAKTVHTARVEPQPVPLDLKSVLATLENDPTNQAPLEQLQAFYASRGQTRLASYFQGRIKQLSNLGGSQ
ncbi:MAG: hypothetical protein IT289_04260 [Oligoflexia bacterium]|nr:hypothetical protein [Oligoflexia bacterium]